jgi:vacuolar-type H+-ATPase subunit H
MTTKIDSGINKATGKARDVANKATDKAQHLAHAVTDKAREVAKNTGNAVKSAGDKIKKLVG